MQNQGYIFLCNTLGCDQLSQTYEILKSLDTELILIQF